MHSSYYIYVQNSITTLMIIYLVLKIHNTNKSTTTQGQSGLGSNCHKGILHTLQSPRTEYNLVTYPGYSWMGGGVAPLQKQFEYCRLQNRVVLIWIIKKLHSMKMKISKDNHLVTNWTGNCFIPQVKAF